MGTAELFILAVGLSMDAFAVSVCKGLSLGKINWKHMGIAGAWFGGFQALMPLVGYLLGSMFTDLITSVSHWIAFVLSNRDSHVCLFSGRCEDRQSVWRAVSIESRAVRRCDLDFDRSENAGRGGRGHLNIEI